MREDGIMLLEEEPEEGLLGGAAMVAPPDLYTGSGLASTCVG